jgi:hypothetical protein
MNERIKQLYKNVLASSENMRWNIEDAEKFAELIIDHATECVRDVLRDENSDLSYTAATQVQNRIKQYFGVEEIMEDQPDEIEYCPTCGEEWSGTSCGALRCGWIEGNEE